MVGLRAVKKGFRRPETGTGKENIVKSMNSETVYDRQRWTYPHIGQRIVKTTIAVFICLILYYLWGFEGENMPTEAMITAILCMQPYVRDSRDYAINRLTGTLIGAFWGWMFLIFLFAMHSEGERQLILYAGMAVGVLVSMHSAVLIGKPDTAGLAAIVFLCVVIAFPDIKDPLRQAGLRIIDLFIGTLVAIGVNVFRLPREKQKDKVFFVRTKDLVPDRFSPIPPAAMFRLNYLYDDGARICLMSEHAPAFFALQMSNTKLNTPLIVMDGAGIFDANENCCISAETLPVEDSRRLIARLQKLCISFFVYTVHRGKTCIFHYGALREPEQKVFERMKRSPYREYLDGEIYEADEIVYLKILDEDAKIAEIEHHLSHYLPKGRLRAVIRKQAGAEGVSGLYIYAHTATMDQAKKRLMAMLHEEDPDLTPVDIRLRRSYHSELDAMSVLHTLGNCYEPVRLFRHSRRSSKTEESD